MSTVEEDSKEKEPLSLTDKKKQNPMKLQILHKSLDDLNDSDEPKTAQQVDELTKKLN